MLHTLHGALFARVAVRVRVIRHGSGQNGALEGNRGAQIVGLKRFGELVVHLDAAVHRNVFKAHAAFAAHKIVLRAGNFPLALLLRADLFRVVHHVGARVAAEKPIRNVQPAHLRNAVAAVQKDVGQQLFPLEVVLELLLRLLLRHDEGNHLFRLHAALDAVGQDRGAAAVRTFGGGGGLIRHQFCAAVLAEIGPHARLACVEAFGVVGEGDLVAAFIGSHHFQRFRLVMVAAGGAFQLAAFSAELERTAAAWAIITDSIHGSSFFRSK